MRTETVDSYLVDENSEGELLFILPDLGPIPDEAWFEKQGEDLLLFYADGETVRLPEIPETLHPKLAKTPSILIVETDDETPLRCYEAKRRET